jgi:prephenate dehydrogenase
LAQLFKQVTICGVGLIGGSLALVARRDRLVGRVVGLGRTQSNLDVAVTRGMLDFATRDAAEAARGADLIVLAVPIVTMRETLTALLPHCAPDAVITDVGSAKGWVVRELEPLIPRGMSLVAAHPVAGKETTGAGAADENLFRGRRVILTPSARSTADAVAKVEALWRATGARVERLDPGEHDALLARASHLPQLVASALAAALEGDQVGARNTTEYGASGLRDTTRLAASSWEMWRDIFATNRDAIASAAKLFSATFAEFQRAIENDDMAGLEKLFNRGRAMRERLK